MLGSIYRGYDGVDTPSREYNIATDIPAAQQTFEAGWPMVITPVDTCDAAALKGDRFLQLMRSTDNAVKALLDSYCSWCNEMGWDHPRSNFPMASAILFDTVAVALVYREDFFEMEEVSIRIDDNGMMQIDPTAKKVRSAINWEKKDEFEEHLTRRLLGLE